MEEMAQGGLGLFLEKKTSTYQTNRNQLVISRENCKKKETLNSSGTWKYQKWVKEPEAKEKPKLASLEKDLKVKSIWWKKQFGKMKKITLLKFLSICRMIMYVYGKRKKSDISDKNFPSSTNKMSKNVMVFAGVDSSLAASFETLAHCGNVASLSLF